MNLITRTRTSGSEIRAFCGAGHPSFRSSSCLLVLAEVTARRAACYVGVSLPCRPSPSSSYPVAIQLMSISALNAWRWVYLAEAALAIAPLGRRRWLRATLVLGGALWLGHDLAHGRWRVAPADAVGLICCLAG